MNIKVNIGRRIKELRKKKNLSQENLAEIANIAQNTLSYIENGTNFCSVDTLERIIQALDIEPNELFEFRHYKDNDTLLNEIIKILSDNPDKIQEIYRVIKAVIN